jgi:hypothetical protein
MSDEGNRLIWREGETPETASQRMTAEAEQMTVIEWNAD